MEFFHVHFFKEKTREKDIKAIIAFFEVIEGFDIKMDEDSVEFDYTHPRLGYKASFIIMPKSQVEDIHRLNPKYLDINFHLKLPILTPNYFATHMFQITKKLTEKFDYFVYQTYFEDVLPFKEDLLMKIFKLVKDKYLELNPKFFKEYHLLAEDKLSSILRYVDDSLELHNHYKDLDTYVPPYHFLLNEEDEVKLAIEWQDDTLTVLPPYLDYIFFSRNNDMNIVKYEEASKQLSKYLEEVPGFIRNTLVVTKKGRRRALRTMRRYKFSKVTNRFTKIEMTTLLD